MQHRFGGIWTRKKLAVLEAYLLFYTTALKNTPFTLHYADAFAGTGSHDSIRDNNETLLLPNEGMMLSGTFRTGSLSRIRNEHANRLRLILGRLEASTEPKDMNLPGLKLHELKGKRRGSWSVSVSGNWRVTFKFKGNDVVEVDYEDYH